MQRGPGFALIGAGLMLYAGACSGSGGSPPPAPPGSTDTTPPTVVSTSPSANTLGAPARAVVSATFSEPIDAASVTATTFFVQDGAGARVAGTIAVAGDTAIFTPAAPLGDSAAYAATLTPGIRDRAGNGLPAAFTWHFSTAATPDTTPPAVLSVSPANGATGVLVGAVVTATFTEALDPASVGASAFVVRPAGGAAVSGTVALDGATLTFTPTSPLAHATTYQAAVAHGAHDAAGNALATDHVWSFDTAPAPGANGPVVVARSPSAGASGVSRATSISVTFDAAIAPASVTATSFSLKARNGAVVAGTFVVSGDTVTLTPAWSLFYWTTYDVALTTGIQDLAGHPLQGAVGWSFQIEPDLTASFPDMAATPSDGATGVIAGTRVLALLNGCGACTYDVASVDGTSFALTDGGGTPVPGTISFPGSLANVAAFVPASPLTPGTRYTATLTTAVRTAAGTPLAAPYAWSFTTVTPGIYDEAFGAGGTFFGRAGGASAVAVQADGKVVVAGSTPEPHQAFVFRTTAAGALDGTFGVAGEVVHDGGYEGPWANTTASAIALQGDGRILIAGRSYQGTVTLGDAFVLRLDASGALDGSFGPGGVVFRRSDRDAYVSGVAVQGGKIVLASNECQGACDVVLLRYLGDGTPDPSFGAGGVVTYPGYVSGIAVDSAGRLLAAGTDADLSSLRRFLDDGTLDTAFGTNGIIATPGGRLAAGVDGAVVLARVVGSDLVVERRLATGALDPAFGTGGQATLSGVGIVSSDAVAVFPDGRVAVAGTLPTSGGAASAARVVRFTRGGVLDTTFGPPPTAGQVICDVGPLDFTTGGAVAVAPTDGKTVFAGTYFEFALTGRTMRALVGRLH